jgi:hypothetical protein
MLFEEVNSLLKVGPASRFRTVMRATDKVVDGMFVLFEEGMNMLLVEKTGTLSLRKD